jgi:hypothetical protein
VANIDQWCRESLFLPAPSFQAKRHAEVAFEAKLITLAQEKGVTTDALLRAAINALLAEAGNAPVLEPIHSLRGLLAKYGPAPSADEIAQNRAEMFADFPRSGL